MADSSYVSLGFCRGDNLAAWCVYTYIRDKLNDDSYIIMSVQIQKSLLTFLYEQMGRQMRVNE